MITNQAYLFLIFIIDGIIIGLLFDFFRILRKTIKTSDIITYIQDALFWILTGIIILYTTFTFNDGEIRMYMFIAILLGVICYITLISSYIIKINVKIVNIIKNIIIKIFSTIIVPFKCSFRWIKNLFDKMLAKKIKNNKKRKVKEGI